MNDVNELEKKYRDEYRGGNTAVMYFLYLNGDSSDNGNAVGVAYHGSSVAIFIERLRNASTVRITPMELERAVLVHEAGHLFRLVEIDYTSQHDHHDDSHPHHCDHTDDFDHHDCVMYYRIETTGAATYDSYFNTVVGDIPNDFCEFCRADLQMLRQKARS